jgi:hypothetical protein
MSLKVSTIIALFTLAAASLFAQTTQSITGTVTDAMCGAHHMMKDVTAANALVPASNKDRILRSRAVAKSIA